MNIRHNRKRDFCGTALVIAASVVAFGAMAVPAHATVIIPSPISTTTVTPTGLPGTLLTALGPNDTFIPGAAETEPFTGYNAQGGIVFEGTVTSYVFSDTAEPNFAGNPAGLDFVYQLSNNNVPTYDPIDRISLSSFAGFQTDVDYIESTGNVEPATADRSVTPGTIVGFNFLLPSAGGFGMVRPGQDSDYLVVATDASTYVQGVASVIDGGSGFTNSDAPVATVVFSVPEPATLGLLAITGGMLLGRRRR